VAHLSEEGVVDVLDISGDPIIASHTNPRAIAPHPHNLEDGVLRRIADQGGVVGVFFLNPYLTQNASPTVEDILRVIEHLINLVGVNHIAIGPDIMENWDQAEFKAVTEGAERFESVPVRPIDYEYPEGYDSIAALPALRATLPSLGLGETEIDKIFGGNCLRLWSEVW
jgi:membrane dipeptidase